MSLMMVKQPIKHAAFSTAIWAHKGDNAGGFVAKVYRQITKSLVAVLQPHPLYSHVLLILYVYELRPADRKQTTVLES